MSNKNEDKSSLECLVPVCNMLIDLVTDKRIPIEIRREYCLRIDKEFPIVRLISDDYYEQKLKGK